MYSGLSPAIKNFRLRGNRDKSSILVGICGLEPQTSSLSVTRSNQLSYIPELLTFGRLFANAQSRPLGVASEKKVNFLFVASSFSKICASTYFRKFVTYSKSEQVHFSLGSYGGGVTGTLTLDLRLAKAAL